MTPNKIYQLWYLVKNNFNNHHQNLKEDRKYQLNLIGTADFKDIKELIFQLQIDKILINKYQIHIHLFLRDHKEMIILWLITKSIVSLIISSNRLLMEICKYFN